METVCFSETLVSTYESTRRHECMTECTILFQYMHTILNVGIITIIIITTIATTSTIATTTTTTTTNSNNNSNNNAIINNSVKHLVRKHQVYKILQ
jgi:hypothetical protein